MNRIVCFGPLALLVVGCALYGGPAARAAVIQTSLDTLVPGGANAGGIVIAGERFSEFAFRSTVPYDVRAADVTVRLSNVDPFDPVRTAIEFIFGTDTAATQAGEVFIDYRVDELSADPINRMGVRFTGPVPSQGVGDGFAVIRQTVSTVNGADLTPSPPVSSSETLVLSNDGPGRSEDVNSQFLPLNRTHALRLATQISLNGLEDGRLDVQFTNHFSTIPEPSAAAIAIPAALTLLARHRRGRRRTASLPPAAVA